MDTDIAQYKIRFKFGKFKNELIKPKIKDIIKDSCYYLGRPQNCYVDLGKRQMISANERINKRTLNSSFCIYTVNLEDNKLCFFKNSIDIKTIIDNEKEMITFSFVQDEKELYSYYSYLDFKEPGYYYNEISKRKLKSNMKFSASSISHIVIAPEVYQHKDIANTSFDKFVELVTDQKNNHSYRACELIISYLSYRRKYPEVDNLIQKKFNFVVDMISYDTNLYNHFFKGNTFKKNFILSKDILNYMVENNCLNYSFMGHLNKLQFLTKVVTLEIVKKINDSFRNNTYYMESFFSNLTKVIEDHSIDLKQALAYLDRVDTYQAIAYRDSIGLWKDYLNNMKKLGIEDFNKYPNSLKREHDVAARELLKVKDELEEKAFAQAMIPYADITFANDKYCIVVPQKGEDLIAEGRTLSHCVGTYVSTVSQGNSVIFFVRKKEDKETPLYTLEVRNRKIAQFRGKYNCQPEKEAFTFAEAFVAKVLHHNSAGEVADLAI